MNNQALIGIMAIAALFGAAGQIMLKKSSSNFAFSIPGTIGNAYLWGFILFYGAAVLINILAYKAGGKVSMLYPVISLSYGFTLFMAWFFLGESISVGSIAGVLLITAGIVVIGLTPI